MRRINHAVIFSLVAALFLLLNASGAWAVPKASGPAGGTCTVVAGPNTGKTGTFDDEGSCCKEGPGGWGCTDCKNQDGTDNGKCTAGLKKRVTRPPVAAPIPPGGGIILRGVEDAPATTAPAGEGEKVPASK